MVVCGRVILLLLLVCVRGCVLGCVVALVVRGCWWLCRCCCAWFVLFGVVVRCVVVEVRVGLLVGRLLVTSLR